MSTQRKRNHLRTKWYSMLHRDSHSRRPPLVCVEWRVYERFAADVGEPPHGDDVLCMRDPALGFRSGNVFWGSKQQRFAHRRHLRTVTVGSEKLNLTECAERLGIHRVTLAERLRRHEEAIAVTAPKLPRGGSRIRKTTRRKDPCVHLGIYDREAAIAPDPEIESLLTLLQQCQGDVARIRNAVAEWYGAAAADRAAAVLSDGVLNE